ncbi:delta-60 repeat domain-containing protein [Marinactinospora thermotolerans]
MPHSHRTLVTAALSALALTSTALYASPALAGLAHDSVVSERPVAWTPHVLDGSVKAIAQVGDVIVVGGDFTRVMAPNRTGETKRAGLFAFRPGTGELLTEFRPEVNGTVISLVPSPDGGVFVGGDFTTVNGEPQQGVTKLSVPDGKRVTGFTASLEGGSAYRLAQHGGRLYVGGSFTAVNGQARTGLARLDGVTGKLDPHLALTLSEPRSGRLRVQELAVSPDGRRLVIGGTFTVVDGERRYQIAMIDTGSSPARLSAWSTEAYSKPCDYEEINTYIRQMDFAPDGSYFAVVTRGGPEKKPGLCKTVARWENEDRAGAEPTWVNYTGGDSIHSVAVTGSAVYVGGHQRWMDNPEGDKDAGPGAVERSGIAAVDPVSGKALAWNPGRTRGYGVEALTPTPDGLYVGSDTDRLAGEYHARLGMFPIA